MAFIIRQISYTADGREIVRPKSVEKRMIVLGRSADSDIHLPDLNIAPEHARLDRLDDRRVRVVASGGLDFEIDGRPTSRTEVDVTKGAELGFGGHLLTFSREMGDIVIAVRRVEALSDASEEKNEAEVFSLSKVLPSRRIMAWGGVVAILLAFLIVPIISHAFASQDDRKIDQVIGDKSWSSGKLSQAHHQLEGNCEACHQQAFVSVRDSACVSCHTSVHDHAPANRMGPARRDPGLGGAVLAGFAKFFGKEGEGSCVSCHTEHEGAGAMQPTAQAFCVDCHGTLDERLINTKLQNASDFGTDHPQFRPAVMVTPGVHPTFQRVSLDNRPQDNSGLKFPHKLHLSGTNGVARMVQTMRGEFGWGNALVCKDCHTPTPDGVRFQPVSMEKNCQMCHSLGFEQIGGTLRTLRHGEPKQVIADIRAYYRSTGPVRPDFSGMARRRPGDYAQAQTQATFAMAAANRPGTADAAIRAVFSQGGACFDCHQVTPPRAGADWGIVPVKQTMRYMQKGWFSHDPHRTETCQSCHKADASNSSTDLLLPGIAVCRDCHLGEASNSDVPSSCALCHSYHADDGAPWTTRDRVARGKPGTNTAAGGRSTGSK